MKRRAFMSLLGGAAALWPLAARAQQPGKLPIVGFMGPNTRSAASEWIAAFVQRLREHGWIDGRNMALEYRWVEGREERFAEVAAELVRLKVDVTVTSGTPAVMALKQATSVIPIIFATAGDPVGNKLVAEPGEDRVATSPAWQPWQPILPRTIRNFTRTYSRSPPIGGYGKCWQSLHCAGASRGAGSSQHAWPRRLHTRNPAMRGISRPRSKRSRGAAKRSMSVLTRSLTPTGSGSTSWRSARDCRRCMGLGIISKQEV